MTSKTNRNTLLPVTVLLLAMAGTTFAEPLLFPLHIGLRYEYEKSDNTGAEWPVYIEVTGQVTINSVDYFQVQEWNNENNGAFADLGPLRATEDALFRYNPTGPEYVDFRKAPVGTTWSYFQPDASGMNYVFVEIVAMEPVTVPYDTFDTAYVHRKCLCVSPDGLGARSPYWQEWVVPGVGFVKQVDNYGELGQFPPMIMELVDIVGTISDHVFSIEMSNCWDYEDPSTIKDSKYKFNLSVETDDAVDFVEVITPGTPGVSDGFTFEILNSSYNPASGTYRWEHEAGLTDPCGLDEYGDGLYTVTFFYDGGGYDETTVWFGIPDSNDPIPQPTEEPVLTLPAHNSSIFSPVTFTWEPCTDPNALEIYLLLQEAAGEEIEGVSDPNETHLGPVHLGNGNWQARLDFRQWYIVSDNGDGIHVEVGKCSEADYLFEVAPPAEIEVTLDGEIIYDGQTEPIDFETGVRTVPSRPLKFIIENIGGLDLGIGTVYLHNNNGFEITKQPDPNLGPYSDTSFKVRMLTDTIGSKSADIEFSNSDSDENPFNFTVVGTVEEPYIDLITGVQFARPVPPYILSDRTTPIDLDVLVANAGNIEDDTRIDIQIFARPAGAADDSQDILIEAFGDYCRVPPPIPVPLGFSSWHNLKIYIPADMPLGEYVLGVKVDTSNEVQESNEQNNTALTTESITIVEPYIDLTASVRFKEPMPTSVVSGFGPPFDLEVAISNVGNITVNTSIDIGVFARPVEAVDDSQDILIRMLHPPVPPPHSTFEGTLRRIVLPRSTTGGRYVIGLKVDTSNEVDESNEDNNTALTDESIRVIEPFVDLIAAVSFRRQPPFPVVAGTVIELMVAVRNFGDLRDRTRVDVEIFARRAGAGDVLIETLLNRFRVPPPHRTIQFPVGIYWPSGMAPGVYHIGVKVDTSNEVDEFHEDNNTALTENAFIVLP